jgi:U3 small nucleolar RNA-associated protein 12
VWDLVTQHCIQTCVEHRAEVWSFDVSPDGSRMVTGAGDNMLRLWRLRDEPVAAPSTAPVATTDGIPKITGLVEVTGGTEAAAALHEATQPPPVSTVTEESGTPHETRALCVCYCPGTPGICSWIPVVCVAVLEYIGSVPRLRNERAGQVRFSDDGSHVACLAAGKGCEVFRVRSQEEVKKKMHRRKKRLRERGKDKGKPGCVPPAV